MGTKLLILLAILFVSCVTTKQQREDNRVAKKIEKIKAKHPISFDNVTVETVRIDTIIKEIRVQGETILDTIKVTEFLTEYLHDTIEVNNFINRFIKIAKDTIQVDSLGIHLTIEGVGVNYKLIQDEQHIIAIKDIETITITKTEVINKTPWYIWTLIIGLLAATLFALLKN